MSFLAHRRFRRVHALLLCTLWLVGFEIGPGLHVALHAEIGHHHHGPVAAAHEHPQPDVAEHEAPAHHEHEAPAHHEHAHEPAHHEHEPAHHEHEHEPAHHAHEEAAAEHHEHEHEAVRHAATDSSGEHEHAPRLVDTEHDTAVARLHDLNHGAHALAHRGIAASPTPDAWPPVAAAPWVYLSRASFALEPIRSRAPQCARARGPPVLS